MDSDRGCAGRRGRRCPARGIGSPGDCTGGERAGNQPNGSGVATIGVAVDVDPVALSIRRTSTIAPASAAIVLAKFGHQDAGATGRRVVVSPDGGRIFAANRSGIVKLAASDLSATRRLLSGTRIDALGITPDGKGLFALRHSDGRVVRLDVTTGAVVAEVPGSGYDRLLAVVPWEP